MQMKNCTTTLENDLTVLKNLKICLSYDQAIPLLGIYAREKKAYVHTLNLYINIHIFTCNDQKLERSQMSIQWMNKPTVVYPHNAILPWNKKSTSYWYTQQLG